LNWIIDGSAPPKECNHDVMCLLRAFARHHNGKIDNANPHDNSGAIAVMERLLWYRFQITSALSILHRLTGIALAVGSILLAWWLVAVAAGGGDGGAAFHRVYPTPTTEVPHESQRCDERASTGSLDIEHIDHISDEMRAVGRKRMARVGA
jgi:hypothetical protein